jgi:hypothetical protein
MNGIGGISQKGFTFSKEKAAIGKTSFANSAFNIQTENIGAVQSDVNGLLLSNPTLAILGTQQLSPPIVLQGNGWGTTSSTSQDVRFKMEVSPLQGAAAAGVFKLTYSLNNGSYTNGFDLNSSGGFTFYNSMSCLGQITANNGIQTSSALAGNFYLANSVSATNTSGTTQLYLAGSTSTGVRIFLGGGTTNYTIAGSAAFGSTIFPNNSVTEAASGTHPIIANVAIKPIVITNGGGATTDAASLYIDGPASGITPIGGLYSILVASGTSKLNGDLYCNGIFTNTGATSSNAYCDLKAGTTTVAPLKIAPGTNMTSPARGALEYNGSHYETNVSFLRYGKGGSVNESMATVSNVGVTETDLFTYTSPAGFFTNIGDKCNIDLGGTVVGNANGKTFKFSFGGTVIFNTVALTLMTNVDWYISIKLIMTSSSKVKYIVSMITDRSASLVTCGEFTATLTASNIIKLTGTGVANGEISLYMGEALYFPASNP